MNRPSKGIDLRLPWARRQWRRVVAWLDDHPAVAVVGGLMVLLFGWFYFTQLKGLNHMCEAFGRWRLDNFGGEHRVAHSIQVSDVVLSFDPVEYDRVDAMMLTSFHISGTALFDEWQAVAQRPGSRVRILVLNPRLEQAEHPHHERFVALGKAKGLESWAFAARVWHSTAILLRVMDELGPAVEGRLVDSPSADAETPFFSIGRGIRAWREADPSERLDILVFNPADSARGELLAAPALIIKDRPDNPEARRFEESFARLWESSKPIDAALRSELLQSLDAPRTR